MSEITSDPQGYVKQQIEHHKKWKSRWSFLYFFFAASTIVAGAATTAVAGIFDGDAVTLYTVILAALTTILASLEKVLKLRDKWDLHRNTEHALQIVLFSMQTLSNEEVIERIRQIITSYSDELSGIARQGQDSGWRSLSPPSPLPIEIEDERNEGTNEPKNDKS